LHGADWRARRARTDAFGRRRTVLIHRREPKSGFGPTAGRSALARGALLGGDIARSDEVVCAGGAGTSGVVLATAGTSCGGSGAPGAGLERGSVLSNAAVERAGALVAASPAWARAIVRAMRSDERCASGGPNGAIAAARSATLACRAAGSRCRQCITA